MITPHVDKVMLSLRRLGYKVYDDGRVNLVGIRKDWNASNRFDDTMVLFYMKDGAWQAHYWAITTDPGWYHLEHGLSKGTAVMKEGQYVDSYQTGLHQGKYEALVQGKPVTVYRDVTKDHILDRDKTETGFFGINIHKAGASSVQVDKWSAGCQVFANEKDFKEMLTLVKQQGKIVGSSMVTYTLIEERDLA